MKWAFWLILAVRIVNALSIRTFFQLDEYFQSLEPLYYLVYGHGILTWEWHEKLRSCIPPLMFAAIYEICRILSLGNWAVRYLPKIFQLIISSIGEYHLVLLLLRCSRRYKIALITLFLSLTSPFNWFFITRTFSNNLEMLLTLVALNYFPMSTTFATSSTSNYVKSILLATLACIIRPTNASIWLFLGLDLLKRSQGSRIKIILVTTLTISLLFFLNVLLDYIFYGEITFPIYNFLRFNVLSSTSKFYGMNSLSFYLVQLLPVIMTTYLPLMIIGLLVCCSPSLSVTVATPSSSQVVKKLSLILFCNITIFSLVSHKEFRFIFPLMPIFMILSSYGYDYLSGKNLKYWKRMVFLVLTLNVLISYYMTRVHESGVISVVQYLKEEAEKQNTTTSIGFLTPCHSVPDQSYFNTDPNLVHIWSLTCEPPLNGEDVFTYMDESDYFYEDPVEFMRNLTPIWNRQWPDYVVIFDALPDNAKLFLSETENYKEISRFFNTKLHWDSRRNGDVVVLLKQK